MTSSRIARLVACAVALPLSLGAAAPASDPAERLIAVDITAAATPVDRFYDLSVGSDFPGTLIRQDS